jgi:ClpP class serine protease
MWFVADRIAREMRARVQAGLGVTADAQAAFAHDVGAARDGRPRNYSMAGDIAEIRVEGLLTEKPDFFAWLMGYGNTTYRDIQQSVALAETDPGVKRIQYSVNSPGGTVAGLFDTVSDIAAAKKPSSVLTSFAASAAYTIAAVGGPITATNAGVEIGSVGVAVDMLVWPELVQIANTESPKKRPDVTTEEGQAVIREELDALFDLLVEAIAYGRETTVKDVRENFGQGGLLVAAEAKRRGMVDKVQRPMLRAVRRRSSTDESAQAALPPAIAAVPSSDEESTSPVPAPVETDAPAADVAAGKPVVAAVVTPEPSTNPATSGEPEVREMDIKQLEKDHPDVFAAAIKVGVDQERDRVTAHLQAGEDSGDMETASAAIRDGSTMTQALVAKYMGANMRRTAIDARQKASDEASAATTGAEHSPEQKDLQDIVADNIAAGLGL